MARVFRLSDQLGIGKEISNTLLQLRYLLLCWANLAAELRHVLPNFLSAAIYSTLETANVLLAVVSMFVRGS